MQRTLIAACFVIAGCGKKDAVDCVGYAEHLAEVNTIGLVGADREKPRESVRISAEAACRNGRVKATEVTCVMSARSIDQTRECSGLGPVPEAPPPPATTRAQTKGISIAVAAGWNVEKTSDPRDGELMIREDKPDTSTHVSGGVFLSRGPAKVATTAEECATKGQNMGRPPAKLRKTSFDATPLGPTCHIDLADDRMVILSQSIGTGPGEAVIFNCYHDINDAGPSPACAEMFASIKLEP